MNQEFQKEIEEIEAEIPLEQQEEVLKMLQKLEKRAKDKLHSFIGWTFSPVYFKEIEWAGLSMKREVVKVTIVFETLKIPGWDIVAIIDHVATVEGNLIYKFNDNHDIPEFYRFCEPNCQHCLIQRQRE
jgi:hypothetical protein